MNTIEIGDQFEEKSYDLIEKALNNQDLGIIPELCSVFKKKGYFSRDRNSDIIFDLSIEVHPKNSERYSLLCLIECKNYKNPVPVSDLEEFYAKTIQITNTTVKPIFITNNKLQQGALEYGKSKGMMLIEVNDDDYNIIFHRNENNQNQKNDEKNIESQIKKLLESALLPKIIGLKKLSAQNIENITLNFLDEFDPDILGNGLFVNLDELILFLKNKYNLEVRYSTIIDNKGNLILGHFDSENNLILINKDIVSTNRFSFTLAHEVGHFVLHKSLKMNQTVYNNFNDTEFYFFSQKYKLVNDKNWIEWQANQFASFLLMPKICIMARLLIRQSLLGMRNKETIYIDGQIENIKNAEKCIKYLSKYFNVSKTSMEYRLESIGILKYGKYSESNYEEEKEKYRQQTILRANEYLRD